MKVSELRLGWYQQNSRFFSVLAVVTFILLTTAQVFWSTIHGDGAVYAWVVKEVSKAGLLSHTLPNWDQNKSFAEHPYLFFYFSSLFTKLFGFSDLALKIPNFVIVGVTLFGVYKFSVLRNRLSAGAHQIGLISAYVIVFNSAYMMQASQPSLDPMAQLFALLAVGGLIFYRSYFFSGFLLGLAFLTKGLEILPHLAALFLLTCHLYRTEPKHLVRILGLQALGLFIPVAIWFGTDYFLWDMQWTECYWERQFLNRFLSHTNIRTPFTFSYLFNFLQTYSLELFVIAVGLWKSKNWSRRNDPLFIYFLLYTFFNVTAFLLIKKNSSQHLTCVFLLGAAFVGEYLYDFWMRSRWRILKVFPLFLFLLSFVYWCWFMVKKNENPDMWTSIKNAGKQTAREENLPIVIQETNTGEDYGIFYTVQWYFSTDKVYMQSEASRMIPGREAIFITDIPNLKIVKATVK